MFLAAAGFGVHLALEEQRLILSFAAPTTATIIEARLERHERTLTQRVRPGHNQPMRSRFVYEPVVRYRFEVEGRQFTGANILPNPVRIGGNLGYLVAKAPLERFEAGQQTHAYFNSDNPSSACLIRRPSMMPYLVVLGTVIAASILATVFGKSHRTGFEQRKVGWIAAGWLLIGLAAAAHYFWLAGSDYGGVALTLFALYLQVGLVPVMSAMPASASCRFVEWAKGAIGSSLFGSFIGFWLGLLIGWVAMAVFSTSVTTFLRCWGYTIAISSGLFVLLSFVMEWVSGEQLEPPSGRVSHPEPLPQPGSAAAPPEPPIPYFIDQRPMPNDVDFAELLPRQVGSFVRGDLDVPDVLGKSSIYARYSSDQGEIFAELGVCDNAETAWKAVETSKAETEAEFPYAPQIVSLKTEPSFFKINTERGAFMSWTRGSYYFSAHARGGEKDLDRLCRKPAPRQES